MTKPEWALTMKEFPDGRVAFTVVRFYNTQLTIGRDIYTYEDAW